MGESDTKTVHKLISSNDEVGNVRTFVFDAGGVKWLAGQYQRFTLPYEGDLTHDAEHWFTIAAAPFENEIYISTRITDSKYKQQLNSLKPGEAIVGSELGGGFTWEDEKPIVMVAAGIGITPFRSILMQREHEGKKLNCSLLYFNRDEQVPFKALLEDLAEKHPELKLQVITGERVTAARILELAPESKQQTVYLSGPKPLVLALSEELEKQDIKTKQDRFPGYDESNY